MEKSVLKYKTYFDKYNSLAVCGNKLNKNQLNLLVKNFDINEIIIAFDKEYENTYDKDGREYLAYLTNICKKYLNYCNFSFIFDKENLLNRKDSPIDQGKEKFIELYKKRIKVRS